MSGEKRVIQFNTKLMANGGKKRENTEDIESSPETASSSVNTAFFEDNENASHMDENSASHMDENSASPEDAELAQLVESKDLEEENNKLEREKKEHLAKQSKNKDYVEALNEYFKIKADYEKKLLLSKRTIYQNTPNKKKAHKLIADVKPKCIYCNRPVGTLFSHKNNRYIAVCGDARSPCNLNIEIFNGTGSNIIYNLELFKEGINELKEHIILQKLDTLFNYVSEERSIQLFKKQLTEYNENSELYKEFLDTYNELFDNQEKREQLRQKNELVFRYTEKSRNLLDDYKRTQNREFIKLAVEVLHKEIAPEIARIRHLRNEVMEVNDLSRDPDFPDFNVFTYPVALSKIDDYNAGEERRVIHFVR